MQTTAEVFRNVVCPGDTTQLTVSTKPFNCGIATGSCLGFTDTFTIGAHTPTWWTAWPGPYNGSYFDTRLQFMYRKSELNAMGIYGGVINNIAFNVANKNSSPGFTYRNWNVKMGCTNLTSMAGAGWQTGLQTVVDPMNYGTTLGWNYHSLDNEYEWDGESNLIIEVCFDAITANTNDPTYYHLSGFTSTLFRYMSSIDTVGCDIQQYFQY